MLGNIIWIVFGGFFLALEYFLVGIMFCISIIGIPFGLQSIKMAHLSLFPFGRTSVLTEKGSGILYTLMNILWLLTGGICISLTHLILGLFFCLTIIGIPFGLQHFKLMAVAFTPFGRKIIPIERAS